MSTYISNDELKNLNQSTVQNSSNSNQNSQTNSAANSNTNTQQARKSTQNASVNTPDYSKYMYDANTNDAYLQALAALQNAQKEVPKYAGTYDTQLQDIYNQIINRDKFKYDINADMLYQQYKDQYVNLGQMAMKDTMGQAAALTGGYGSSYGQSVGQQQYDAYLQKLNEMVPDLYNAALSQYNSEGDALYKQYSMIGDRADDEYGKYQDALSQYWQNISYLKDNADDAYSKGYTNWYNAYQMGVDADKLAYQKEQDAYEKQLESYDRLAELITNTGYVPTADELKAAGMSDAQAKAYLNYYNKLNGYSGSSGGRSGGSSGGYRSRSSGSSSGSTSKSSKSSTSSSKSSSSVKTSTTSTSSKLNAAIMTRSEWNQRKAYEQRGGKVDKNVSGYSSYDAYLSAKRKQNVAALRASNVAKRYNIDF